MQHFTLESNTKLMFTFPPINYYYHTTFGDDLQGMVEESTFSANIVVNEELSSGTLESFTTYTDGVIDVVVSFNNQESLSSGECFILTMFNIGLHQTMMDSYSNNTVKLTLKTDMDITYNEAYLNIYPT